MHFDALLLSGYFSILYFSWFVFQEHQAVQNAWREACLFFFYKQVLLTYYILFLCRYLEDGDLK